MGLKQNESSLWKNPDSLCPRKARQVPTKVKVLVFFTPVIAALFVSSFQRTRQLRKLIIWKFRGVWGMQYEGYDRECGQQERGTSIMTMNQLTPCFRFESCWQSIWFLSFDNLRIRLTYPLRTFLIPASKNCPEMKISNGRAHHYEYKRLTERYSSSILGSVLPKAEKAVGVMHCC